MWVSLQSVSHRGAQPALLARCTGQCKHERLGALPQNVKPRPDSTYGAGKALADKAQQNHIPYFLIYYRLSLNYNAIQLHTQLSGGCQACWMNTVSPGTYNPHPGHKLHELGWFLYGGCIALAALPWLSSLSACWLKSATHSWLGDAGEKARRHCLLQGSGDLGRGKKFSA